MNRPHHDRMDIFFLLNQKQILTKKELNNILPLQSYEEYQVSFYKRKLSDFFLKNYLTDWFYSTYLDKVRIIKYHDFNINGEYMVIHGVSNYHSEVVLREIIQKVEGFLDLYLFRPDPTKGFRRDCYVKMEGVDIPGKFEEVRIGLNDFKIEFSSVVIQMEDQEIIKDINIEKIISLIRSISRVYNTTLEEVSEIQINLSPYKDKSSPEFYFYILRNIFLYDYSSSQQFLSDLEFYVKSATQLDNSDRRRELCLNYIDFSCVKNISVDFLLGRFIQKVEDKVYMCSVCEKKFETEDFTEKHQKNKHAEDLKSRDEKYMNFSVFIDSLDLFILNIVEGSLENAPWFFKKRDDKTIVYDMNHIFSGEIVL